MKTTWKTRLFSLVLCLALLIGCVPIAVHAEDTDSNVTLSEGDVIPGFVAAGTACASSDPAVAWVDADGTLCALREGTATISVDGEADRTVTVNDFEDGSPVVGNLKILARYNDSMQFYDGHVYLLFTSYQDGVEITVPDLYAGYEIAPQYYSDIRDDISYGSNHTGNGAEDYFTFNDEMTSVTLDRGEIVTIGMYRDFDLSVPQAALGSVQNSSAWQGLSNALKASVIEAVFSFLNSGYADAVAGAARIKAAVEAAGTDFNKLLDGVVDGGVCFNRELYNQKLEWDQYENVTYELDITENQLKTLTAYLGGNLNKFSILKNSCATVALRAWNAAVGTADGAPNAYYLTYTGSGIFSYIDVPKSVRDSIRDRLPGYCLNNAEGVEEPDAGYQDETGWVYVSAPEKVSPLNFTYTDDAVVFNEYETDLHALLKTAMGDQRVPYGKDAQDVAVTVRTEASEGATVINGVDFTLNGTTVSIDNDNIPEQGLWFSVKADEPVEGTAYTVTDGQDKALASYYDEGSVTFGVKTLPVSVKIGEAAPSSRNLLRISIENEDRVKATTEIYRKDGDNKIALNDFDELEAGTEIYVKADVAEDEKDYLLSAITMNWNLFNDAAHFDAEEGAYVTTMPAQLSYLDVDYEKGAVKIKEDVAYQYASGETLNINDVAELIIDDTFVADDALAWEPILDNESVSVDGDTLTMVKSGSPLVWVYAKSNHEIGAVFALDIYNSGDDMVQLTFDDETDDNTLISVEYPDGDASLVPHSGYLVKKGGELKITPLPDPGQAVYSITVNGKNIYPDTTAVVNGDTVIAVKCADAEIKGMPKQVNLAAKGDTCQLEAKVAYTGLLSLITPYDTSIKYSYDSDFITVDESGLLTVTGDVPEQGAAIIVTARAGSANSNVSASTRVVLGNYEGDRIVGSVTIHARRIYQGELVAHGALTFTTYEDLDLDTSFYRYYKPDDRYNALMLAYEKDPDSFVADPALCSDNALGLENRESYFESFYNGPASEPQTISLLAGETISVSNYGFDYSNLTTFVGALKSNNLSTSAETQEFIRQTQLYMDGNEYDPVTTFDSLLATIGQLYAITGATGHNPADGHTVGGMAVNRELYNQFRRNDLQTPNNYYTVEITADELEVLKSYLANPDNNYYSLFVKNCSTGAVDMWNSMFSDSPELQLSANLSGIAIDPESLYFNVGLLNIMKSINPSMRGKGGTDFYPRTVRYTDELIDAMNKIDEIGEVTYTDECKDKIDAAREAYEALSRVEKERVRNYDVLTDAEAAYQALADAEAAQEYAENIAAYEDYKAEQRAAIDELAGENPDLSKMILKAAAKGLIAAMKYDTAKSLDENKALIDGIVDDFKRVLSSLEPAPADQALLGDADGDGKVDIYDAAAIQKSLAGTEGYAKYDTLEQTDTAFRVADIDGNGTVDVYDTAAIQKWIAGDASAMEYGISEPIA